MILIDTHERKTPEAIVKAFDAVSQTLKIADYCDTDRKVLIEFKIKQDVHSYHRLSSEATRMNLEDYKGFFLHAIYVDLWNLNSFEEFRKFSSICHKANVFPHFVIWDEEYLNLIAEIKKISQPSYNKRLQLTTGFSKKLGTLGQVLSVFLPEDKAGEIENLLNAQLAENLNFACDLVMGVNKDGYSRKAVLDMLTFLQELKGLI